MWDNPRMLNLVANALFGVAAFVVLCIVVIAIVNSRLFPLRTVSVQGNVRHVDAAAIERALQGRVRGNFFGVDLAQVRAAMAEIPWVRRVIVRRHWPDRLVMTIEEHEPLARWGDGRLVNTHGELFAGRIEAPLPQFVGPGDSAAGVTARYREFAQRLAPLEMRIARIELSARHAWELDLAGGKDNRLTLTLGRDQARMGVSERLQRFVDMYERTLAQIDRRSGYVDLRYPNGFALRVPGLDRLDAKNGKAGSA